MAIAFERLTRHDVAKLHQADDDIFDHAIDTERAAAFLDDPLNILVVAIEDGIVVGQIQGRIHAHLDAPDDLFIDNLGVAQRARRRGIARRLIAMALDIARARGAAAAWVLTEGDDGVAQAVYRAAGAAARPVTMFDFFAPAGDRAR